MGSRVHTMFILAATMSLGACGATSVRDQVVYPNSAPIVRPSVQLNRYDSCSEEAEELAPGSICPATARCYNISGGRRCIEYEK